MPIVVSVDGIIGGGKSTLLKELSSVGSIRTRRVVVVQEEVNDWVDQGILKLFYEDPERNAFAFQLHVLCSRAKRLHRAIEENPDAIIVTERTASSDYMFAEMLFDSNKISSFEFKIYQMVYRNMREINLSARVFLKCSPEEALKRCVARSREGEEKITLEYLEQIEKYMNEFFDEHDETPMPILAVSTEIDLNDLVDTVTIFLDEIVRDEENNKFRVAFLRSTIVWAIVMVLSGHVFSFLDRFF
jgi:deoxyadenosine/deoxycytidine kinase